nr:hypothetical protein CFP56_24902 [Quercus suber]
MENSAVQNEVLSSELVNGGCDVWSCKDSDSSSAYHLVVMVNGILGSDLIPDSTVGGVEMVIGRSLVVGCDGQIKWFVGQLVMGE